MKQLIVSLLVGVLILATGFGFLTQFAQANSQPQYAMVSWTIDGGGTTAGNVEPYTLRGSIGQAEVQAPNWSAAGAENPYQLNSGFWNRLQAWSSLFLPMLLR